MCKAYLVIHVLRPAIFLQKVTYPPKVLFRILILSLTMSGVRNYVNFLFADRRVIKPISHIYGYHGVFFTMDDQHRRAAFPH